MSDSLRETAVDGLQVGSLSLRPWESLTPTVCAEFFTRNRAHLAPWEPRREPSFYTAEHQAALLA